MVDHAAAAATFHEVFEPELADAGFERRGSLCWIRRSLEGHDLVEITHLKAASYSVAWGVALDFVPHEQSGELKWHRTAKSARMDLRFDFWDHDEDVARLVCRPDEHPEGFRSVALDLAERALAEAFAWLDFPRDVAGLLTKFEHERARPRHGWMQFENWVQQPLAYACVLTRAGKRDEAARALDAWGLARCSRQFQVRLAAHLDALAAA